MTRVRLAETVVVWPIRGRKHWTNLNNLLVCAQKFVSQPCPSGQNRVVQPRAKLNRDDIWKPIPVMLTTHSISDYFLL